MHSLLEWAGPTKDVPGGGSTMQVKSISVTDYSTGSQYKYTGSDGTWQSITAVGGSVNPKGSKGSPAGSSAPAVSASTNGGPMPFSGTHSDKSTTAEQPNAGGWTPTTMQTSGVPTVTTYPGLPEGWTVTSSGKVLPPSAASVSERPLSYAALKRPLADQVNNTGHIPSFFALLLAAGLAAGFSSWWI